MLLALGKRGSRRTSRVAGKELTQKLLEDAPAGGDDGGDGVLAGLLEEVDEVTWRRDDFG